MKIIVVFIRNIVLPSEVKPKSLVEQTVDPRVAVWNHGMNFSMIIIFICDFQELDNDSSRRKISFPCEDSLQRCWQSSGRNKVIIRVILNKSLKSRGWRWISSEKNIVYNFEYYFILNLFCSLQLGMVWYYFNVKNETTF